MLNKIIKIRIFLQAAFVIIIGWLLYMAIIPGGHIIYVNDFIKENYFIRKLTPPDRIEATVAGAQKIIGDPVYFNLRTPRRFDKAVLTIKYKNNSQRPIIETGVLADKKIWRYNLQPAENLIIDRLATVWNQIKEENTILLQKDKKYKSVNEFLHNLPPREQIALYNYELANEYVLPGYKPENKISVTAHSLRGFYQFYTYIKNEDLDFNFKIFDLNKNRDSDPVDVNLYYRGRLIDSRHLDDDGISNDFGKKSVARDLVFKQKNLPEGIYKLEFRANDDIVTGQIATKQKKLSFINKIWLFDDGKKDIVIFTDSNAAGYMTINPAKTQIIKNGLKTVALDKTYELATDKLSATTTKIVLAKDDVILSGNKVFSFSMDALINPEYSKVDENLDVTQSGIKYILASYAAPFKDGEWDVARAEVDLSDAYRETLGLFASGPSQYGFIISVPGLIVQNKNDEYLEINEIKIELFGTSLIEKIKSKIKMQKSK